MPFVKCPVCERRFDVEHTTAMPFCSDRCRQIDLGRWLDEDYGLPIEGGENESGEDDLGEAVR